MTTLAPFDRPAAADSLAQGLPWALVAHALLLAALAVGVNWQSRDTDGVAEAELWAAVPQAVAPPAVEAPPPPPPAPAERAQARAEAERQAQLEREADIAEKREQERKKLKLQRDEAERKEREAALKKRREDEQRKAEKLEQQQAEKQARAEEARREKLRQENLRRMQGLAGSPGAETATGTALKSAGPSAGYAGRIQAYIRPRITYTGTTTTRLEAEVEVRCAPDGLILARRLVRSSGDAQYDRAVLAAIDKAERIPRDTDGTVPAKFPIVFKYPD